MMGLSPHFLVVVCETLFGLMLFVPHVPGFLFHPVHVVSSCRFILRREHGDDRLEVFPFAMTERTFRWALRSGNHQVFEDCIALQTFVFKYRHTKSLGLHYPSEPAIGAIDNV